MGKVLQFRLASLTLLALASYVGHGVWSGMEDLSTVSTTLRTFLVTTLILMAWICRDIARRRPSETRSSGAIIALWCALTFCAVAKLFLSKKKSSNLAKQQDDYLKQCLRLNANTQYGKDHNLADIQTVENFRLRHPLTSYEHYRPYVDRCLNGETNVLINKRHPIDFFAWTSGTSGKNKVYPYNTALLDENMSSFLGKDMLIAAKDSPFMDVPLLPLCMAYNVPNFSKTSSGVKCGSVGTVSLVKFPSFMFAPDKELWSPARDFEATEKELYYIYSVFGLQERLNGIFHGLAPSTVTFYDLLEEEWPRLCDDIANGTISADVIKDVKIRAKVQVKLQPNPKRAAELRQEFAKGMTGIVKRLWPDASVVTTILSGSFASYRKRLIPYFEGLIVYSQAHGATEGYYGTNLWPLDEDIKYALVPSGAFFEFIPEQETANETPSTVLAHQLEVGKSYEIVHTNVHGFYRYRIGDVIEVVDFYGDRPVYKMKYRLGQMLNADWEKTPETAVLDAITKTTEEWGQGVVLHDFTATESINMSGLDANQTTGKYYVIFVELSDATMKLTDKQKKRVDDNLRQFHEMYDILRQKDTLTQAHVYQVRTGTFARLKDIMLEDNKRATAGQFKMPRVQRNEKYLRFLAEKGI